MTCYHSTCDALVRHEIDHTIVRWIRANFESLVVAATLDGSSIRVSVSRGCPQGAVLSPLCGALWVI